MCVFVDKKKQLDILNVKLAFAAAGQEDIYVFCVLPDH